MQWFKKPKPVTLPAEKLETRLVMVPEQQELPPLPLHEGEQPVQPTPVPDLLETKATSPFHSSDGAVYHTVKDFANALLRMHPGTFSYHANEHKNDYASWIEGCFPAEVGKLGRALIGKSREEMFRLFMHTMLASSEHVEIPTTKEEPKVERIVQDLQAVRLQAQLDRAEAKEQFIRIRNKIWQDFDEDERKAIYPLLRDTYEILSHHA